MGGVLIWQRLTSASHDNNCVDLGVGEDFGHADVGFWVGFDFCDAIVMIVIDNQTTIFDFVEVFENGRRMTNKESLVIVGAVGSGDGIRNFELALVYGDWFNGSLELN